MEDVECRGMRMGLSNAGSFRMMLPTRKGIATIKKNVMNSDVVYQMGMNPFVLLAALIYSRYSGKRYIIGMHNPLLLREMPRGPLRERLSVGFFNAIQMPLLRYIGEVHVQTETQRKRLLAHGYRGRFYYIRHFLYLTARGKAVDSEKGMFRLLFVGRLIRYQKGLDMLDEIIDRVLEKDKKIEVQIIGDGEDSDMVKRLVKEHSGRVTWKGFVDDSELLRAYRSADLFVFPSRYETPGLTLLEAQSYGLPAVAFRVQGPSDIMKRGFQGRLIRPFDTREFAEAILQYKRMYEEDRKGYIRIKNRIIGHIEERYGERIFIKDFSSMLMNRK